MLETMRDRGRFWTSAPDMAKAGIAGDGFFARFRAGLGQTLISGKLDIAISALAPGTPEAGLWDLAQEERVCLRIARDRALLVSATPLDLTPGWRDGFVATPCDDAYAVIEMSGPAMPNVIAEGTSADIEANSRSAAVLFAGVPVLLYRIGADTARIHVESPLAAYLWTWLEQRP